MASNQQVKRRPGSSGGGGGVTAAQFAASLPVGATVATSETLASAVYADLATVGPAVTVTVPASGKVLVQITVDASNSGTNTNRVGVALSGANTVAAADTAAVRCEDAANFRSTFDGLIPMSGLTPGETTFTLKYKGAATATFENRRVTVFPT